MTGELTPDDGRRLLELARRAIEAKLGGRALEGAPTEGALGEARGAFVTLRRREDGELRGCIGFTEPTYPLVETVARAAAAAATSDGRFEPVALAELPRLTLDISVLGPLQPIAPADVRVGTHGLLIRFGGQAGLLLPQVAVEQGWDARTLLEQTCRKAGLPPGSWRQPGAELLAFTATVFCED
jgi:AmmeMemoRadiSam system protein A